MNYIKNKILEKIDREDFKSELEDMGKMEHYNIREIKLMYKLWYKLEEKYGLVWVIDVIHCYCEAIEEGYKSFDDIFKYIGDYVSVIYDIESDIMDSIAHLDED